MLSASFPDTTDLSMAPLGALFFNGQVVSRQAFSAHVRHATSPDIQDGELSLSLYSNSGKPVGTILIGKMSDEGACEILESFLSRTPIVDEQGRVSNVKSLAPETLRTALVSAMAKGGEIKSDLGVSVAQIVQTHASRLYESAVPDFTRRMEKLFRTPAKEGEGASPLRWVRVEGADAEYLQTIAKEFGVPDSLMRACHTNDENATVFRRGKNLFLSVRELVLGPPDPARPSVISVKSSEVRMIIGENLIITIAPQESRVITRVWSEAQRNELDESEQTSPNHLASRIIGCATHFNATSIATLRAKLEEFVERKSGGVPTEEEIDRLRRIRYINADVVDPTLSGVTEIVSALREPANFFGAKGPSDKLERFANIVESNHRALDRIESKIEATDDAWRATLASRSTENLNRVSVLAGVLAVPATVFGFFGMEWNLNLPDTMRWSGTYVALGISTLLLARGVFQNGLGWLLGTRRRR